MINKLKHYLGTGLKMQILNRIEYDPFILKGLFEGSQGIVFDDGVTSWKSKDFLIKPYLRPLSKLTEPIVVENYNDGKEFVPVDEIFLVCFIRLEFFNHDGDQWGLPPDTFTGNTFGEIRLLVDLLHQWHFNLYFEKGEFIEI